MDKPKLYFGCLANVYRSAMAELIAWDYLRNKLKDTVTQVGSFGLIDVKESGPRQDLLDVCGTNGLDVSWHRPKVLLPDQVSTNDIILVMDQALVRKYKRLFRLHRVFLLGGYPHHGPGDYEGPEVDDPCGEGLETLQATFKQLKFLVPRSVDYFRWAELSQRDQ